MMMEPPLEDVQSSGLWLGAKERALTNLKSQASASKAHTSRQSYLDNRAYKRTWWLFRIEKARVTYNGSWIALNVAEVCSI
jgi:hypothetical protein